MAMKYWVGELYVDLTRNQISQAGIATIMAPKALAVLTLLAENQGSVVSQEQILNSVWKDTVVTPNTLQRSIAQLRKALNDDAKQQHSIKTHAKQGYSLELPVRWETDVEALEVTSEPRVEEKVTGEPVSTANKAPLARSHKLKYTLLTGALFVSALTALVSPFKPEPLLTITDIRAVTATDHKEISAIYTQDGEYIVFKRYHMQMCNSRIWAKKPKTQEEILLTPEWGNYGELSFSPDDSKLTFVHKESCDLIPTSSVKPEPCYNLKTIDFQQALKGNTAISTLMTCRNAEIKKPFWLTDNKIVLMHRHNFQWQLITFDVTEQTTQVLHQVQEGNLFFYDYSPTESLLALTKLNEQNQPVLDMVTTSGELLTSHLIEEHPDIPIYRLSQNKFIPNKSLLTFGTGRQIFSLTYDGKVEKISLPLDQPMSTLLFNRQGTKALATKGTYDADIGTFTLSKQEVTQYNNIARTNSGEEMAKFSRDGSQIVFWSKRSGTSQLWLSEGEKITQLTDFGIDSWVSSFLWSNSGTELLVNADGMLYLLGLDKKLEKVNSPEPIHSIFHWDSERNTVLANMYDKGQNILAQIDLNTGTHIKLKDKPVLWADVSPSGQVIYQDHNFRIWQYTYAQDLLIDSLADQSTDKQFILSGETLFGINKDYQLWSYDLTNQALEFHNVLPKNTDYLTDIHGDQVLVSYVIAAKKEIVELEIN